MKTAISIPDEVFVAAEGIAERLGVSRSQLYSSAISFLSDRVGALPPKLMNAVDEGLKLVQGL